MLSGINRCDVLSSAQITPDRHLEESEGWVKKERKMMQDEVNKGLTRM